MSAPLECRSCGSTRADVFAEITGVPAHVGVLWRSREQAAECPRGDIALAFCRDCGFIWNVAFDPEIVDYTQEYNNSLAGSPLFREFDTDLAKELVALYDVHDTTVVEIGAGDARFLSLLCEFGANRGFGFDPSAAAETAIECGDGNVRIVPGEFDPAYAGDDCGLVACRQVLEHVADPHELVRVVRDAFGDSTVAYFEVPNAFMVLQRLSIWDLCYEHCSYFTAEALQYLFESDGYEVMQAVPRFGEQFVSVEARPHLRSRPAELPDIGYVADLVADFGRQLRSRRDTWVRRIAEWRDAEERIAVWGAGARTVGFFALLGVDDEIASVVDVNESKQGTYLAGTRHLIEAPDRLRELQPTRVVIVNPIYEDEIRASLATLGVAAEVVAA